MSKSSKTQEQIKIINDSINDCSIKQLTIEKYTFANRKVRKKICENKANYSIKKASRYRICIHINLAIIIKINKWQINVVKRLSTKRKM